MNKLLIVTTVAQTAEAFLLPFAKYYRSKGMQVDLLANGATTNSRCSESFDKRWEIDWTRGVPTPFTFRKSISRVRQVVAEEEYDLVHTHTPIASFLTRFALRSRRSSAGLKVVYTAHGFHFHDQGSFAANLAYRSAEQLAGRWTDGLVVINRHDERAALDSKIVPAEKLKYMPGIGVDTAVHALDETERLTFRRGLGLPDDAVAITMIAEFIERKRHQDALEAFAGLKSDRFHLLLAGQGPLMDAMRQRAADLGISERVHFLGFRRDIREIISASDFTLLTSKQEGLPRAILESMALGVPVIATDIRGVRELVDSDTGEIVSVKSPSQIKAAIERMAFEKDLRTLGENCLRKIRDYDTRRIFELHDEFYSDVLGRPLRRVAA